MKLKEIKDINELPEPTVDGLPAPTAMSSEVDSLPSPEASGPQYSELESGVMGGVQGASMGFADEIEGALKALGEKGHKIIKGEDEKDLKTLYKQYRDIARKKFKQAEQQNPKSYMGGNVAGGVATGLLTGGTSLPAMGAIGAAQGLGTSEGDLTDAAPQDIMQTTKDVALGGALGVAGGALGNKLGKMLTPQAREAAAGKLAASAAGLTKPEQLAKKGIDVAQVGKVALEEKAVPSMGGSKNILDKTREAIDLNEEKLTPLFAQAQKEIDKNPEVLQQAGNIGDKLGEALYSFRQSFSKDPKVEKIMANLEETYIPYIKKIVDVDGNLVELNEFKKALQKSARDLGAYSKQFPDAKPEAQFVKKLGGIVREHIEDISNMTPDQYGKGIKDINNKLKNLYTYEDAAEKLVDSDASKSLLNLKEAGYGTLGVAGGIATGTLPVVGTAMAAKKGVELVTGSPLGRTLKQLGAKGNLAASKALKTDIGDIILNKGVSNVSAKTVSNPYTLEKIESASNNLIPGYALTNASNDSLKEIGSKLQESEEFKEYGKDLQRAAETNDSWLKKQVIFLLMQNPRAKKILSGEENE